MKIEATKLSRVALISILSGFMAIGCGANDDEESSDEGEVNKQTTETSSGTTTSNSQSTPDSTVSLDVQGSSLALLGTQVDVLGNDGSIIGALDITEAKVVLAAIKPKLSDDSESESDDSLEFKGPYLVDLLTGAMTPDPGEISIPQGNYKVIELKVHKVEDSDAEVLGVNETDVINDNSIYVAGTYTPAGQSAINFSMAYEISEEFKLSGANGMQITPDSVNNFLIAFKFTDWFKFNSEKGKDKNVDFSDLSASDFTFSKDSSEVAKNVREIIKENIKSSADFGEDQDGDGELEEDEDAE